MILDRQWNDNALLPRNAYADGDRTGHSRSTRVVLSA